MIVNHDRRLCYLTQYICELALLQAEMGQYSPAEVAASSVLLSRLLVKIGKHNYLYDLNLYMTRKRTIGHIKQNGVFEHVQNAHVHFAHIQRHLFVFIKVSSGQLLSIDTFCSVKLVILLADSDDPNRLHIHSLIWIFAGDRL